MPKKISIAVMSDLHCHPVDAFKPARTLLFSDMPDRPVKQHPIEALLELIKEEKLTTDALVISGDLTNGSHKGGFAAAWDFAARVKKSLKAKMFVGTVGNHDVARQNVSDVFSLAKTTRKDFPVAKGSQRDKFWAKGFCFVESNDLRILVLNSVRRHADSSEIDRGAINEEDLEELERELKIKNKKKKKVQIAVCHHHPIQHEDSGLGSDDLMVNGDRLLGLLENNGYALVVHGHKHFPRVRYSAGGGNSLVVFASGSLSGVNTPAIYTNTRNLFHIINFFPDVIEEGLGMGVIYTWEFNYGRGWNRTTVSSATIPSVAGFGCRESFEILAKKISKHCNKRAAYSWAQVMRKFPQIEFLIPSDYEHLLNSLSKKYKMKIVYLKGEREVPKEISR